MVSKKSVKNVREELLEFEIKQLKREISDLNLMLNKLVNTNMTLQSKMTESVIRTQDLNKSVKKLVDLFKEAVELETHPQKIEGINELVHEVKEMNQKLSNTDDNMKKIYQRLFVVSKATNKAVVLNDSQSEERKQKAINKLKNLTNI